MAWWDSQNPEFRAFMERLFTDDPRIPLGSPQDARNASADPPPNAFVAKDPKVPAMVASTVKDAARTVDAGVNKSAASPAPSPSPSASGPMDGLGKNASDAYKALMSQYQAIAAGQKKAATPAGITEASPLWIPKWEVYKGQQEAGKGRWLPTTVGEAMQDFQTWSDKKLLSFSKKLVDAGILDAPTINHEKLEQYWESLVARSAKMYSAGRKMNPWDILSRLSASGGGGYGVPKTTTSTNTSYTVTSALTAKQLAHAALSQRLGRDATPDEVASFTKALAAAEKKNPTSTTVTTTTDQAAGTARSTTTTKEGLDAKQYAMDYGLTHNKDEAAAYQAAGYYMPLFFQALGAPV